MGTVILIGTAAVVVAIVGCFFIWRIDASRADEVEHITPVRQPAPPSALRTGATDTGPTPPRTLGS
ncbi:hypothetical protein SAMN04489844_1251 [Nocardioides exalbidus]|uniref:Uncharacterized protein n=1 Tax=Nocardioides exalbidus TaxID=402596 RepID=A0A1H4MYU0_9ACTN|nr:hypothetical protein [Nocardioides exalbidus]SEB88231.1 hypothetical protein SAMN04489844_1251 [Nocardioides exalbidus]